jgi:type I restriction enzyme S subunit
MSIESQNQLIETMKKLESDINLIHKKYEKKYSDLEDLKKSILQKAFSGELTKTIDYGKLIIDD